MNTLPPKHAARSRLIIGNFGPSDSALAASSGWRLLAAQPLTGTRRAALLGTCARAAPLGAIRPQMWHALDHRSGKVLAYVLGRRTDEVFVKLKTLLEPFGIRRYYTDSWGAYKRNLTSNVHSPGKRNTQQIERKHLTLRTRLKRLVRKTICFSKSLAMHDIVIGLFINRYEFGLPV
jgi:insertion element IS1 protein InsB